MEGSNFAAQSPFTFAFCLLPLAFLRFGLARSGAAVVRSCRIEKV
jgi:hypothetical protein